MPSDKLRTPAEPTLSTIVPALPSMQRAMLFCTACFECFPTMTEYTLLLVHTDTHTPILCNAWDSIAMYDTAVTVQPG
jgi:hypothetical protein